MPFLVSDDAQFRILSEAIPQIVWVAAADGNALYVNERGLSYSGLKPHEALGWGWHRAVHPQDLPLTLERWTEAIRTARPYETSFRLRGQDGEYRWHLTRAMPMLDACGQVTRWFGSCTDIQAQMERAGRSEVESLRSSLAAAQAEIRRLSEQAMRERELQKRS